MEAGVATSRPSMGPIPAPPVGVIWDITRISQKAMLQTWSNVASTWVSNLNPEGIWGFCEACQGEEFGGCLNTCKVKERKRNTEIISATGLALTTPIILQLLSLDVSC